MSFFMSSENWSKSHRFVCRFLCRPKTGKKVIGFCMSFFMSSENWSKSHRFVCRFLCRPKTGKKVLGLYVVFYVVRKLGKKS